MRVEECGKGELTEMELCAFDNVQIDPELYGVWKGKKVCWNCFKALVRIKTSTSFNRKEN